MVWKPSKEEIKRAFDDGTLLPEVKAGFRICPLCYEESSITPEEKQRWGGIHTDFSFSCTKCGAKWDISRHLWTGKLKTLRLVKIGSSGRGNELLQIERPLDFWQEMALKGLKERAREGLG